MYVLKSACLCNWHIQIVIISVWKHYGKVPTEKSNFFLYLLLEPVCLLQCLTMSHSKRSHALKYRERTGRDRWKREWELDRRVPLRDNSVDYWNCSLALSKIFGWSRVEIVLTKVIPVTTQLLRAHGILFIMFSDTYKNWNLSLAKTSTFRGHSLARRYCL